MSGWTKVGWFWISFVVWLFIMVIILGGCTKYYSAEASDVTMECRIRWMVRDKIMNVTAWEPNTGEIDRIIKEYKESIYIFTSDTMYPFKECRIRAQERKNVSDDEQGAIIIDWQRQQVSCQYDILQVRHDNLLLGESDLNAVAHQGWRVIEADWLKSGTIMYGFYTLERCE